MSENMFRSAVEDRVRSEHEPAIQAEIDRRLAAVEAAVSGGVEPPPPPRKPRADKGKPRTKAAGPVEIPAEALDVVDASALPDLSSHLPARNGGGR